LRDFFITPRFAYNDISLFGIRPSLREVLLGQGCKRKPTFFARKPINYFASSRKVLEIIRKFRVKIFTVLNPGSCLEFLGISFISKIIFFFSWN